MKYLQQKGAEAAYKELQQAVGLLQQLHESLEDRNPNRPDMETIRCTMGNALDNHLQQCNEWLMALKA